ncbi:MAG: tetratricopeptide repeat protein, partial [Myxococcota bacterium]|nr:tetratricopeptide repeat protein [Myxococcota bacterium]
DRKREKKLQEQILETYKAPGLEPGSSAAALVAKVTFQRLEEAFARFQKLRVRSHKVEKQKATMQKKREMLLSLGREYTALREFRSLEWMVAGVFRIGTLNTQFAQMLYGLPRPKGVDAEELDAYVTTLEDMGAKLEAVALRHYDDVVRSSRTFKSHTVWTERALIALNKYKPLEYPYRRAGKSRSVSGSAFAFDPRAPRPGDADGPPAPHPERDAALDTAREHLRHGRLSKALHSARAAVGHDPTGAVARRLLMRISAHGGGGSELASQREQLERMVQRSPDDLALLIALAEAQLATSQFESAMWTAREILGRADTSATAMKLLARAYLAIDQDVTAEFILSRLLGAGADAEAGQLMAQIVSKRGDTAWARAWLQRALEANPAHIEVLNELGVALIAMHDFSGALEALTAVTERAPGVVAGWLNLGLAQRGAGQLAAAESSWKRVLEASPEMPEAWFNLGLLYLEDKVPGVALQARLEQALHAFGRYRDGAQVSGDVDPHVDAYITEAKRLLASEKKR